MPATAHSLEEKLATIPSTATFLPRLPQHTNSLMEQNSSAGNSKMRVNPWWKREWLQPSCNKTYKSRVVHSRGWRSFTYCDTRQHGVYSIWWCCLCKPTGSEWRSFLSQAYPHTIHCTWTWGSTHPVVQRGCHAQRPEMVSFLLMKNDCNWGSFLKGIPSYFIYR